VLVDFYLCGQKGLSALRVVQNYPSRISVINLARDVGTLDDPFEEMSSLCREKGIDVCTNDYRPRSKYAFSVGWKKMIKAEYKKLFVIHDSLLPKYRGWNPLVTALQNRDEQIGITFFRATDEFDRGPIIWQEGFEIEYPITIQEAINIVSNSIENLTLRLLSNTEPYEFEEHAQNEADATYSIWRDNDDYRIDWSNSSTKIINFIDSVSYPYLGALTTYQGRNLRIKTAEILPDLKIINRTPGKILEIENGLPTVVCGKGLIRLLRFAEDNEGSKEFLISSIKSKFN